MMSSAVSASSEAEIGCVKNTDASPWLMESARRNCGLGERAEDQADHRRADGDVPAAHGEAEHAEDIEQ